MIIKTVFSLIFVMFSLLVHGADNRLQDCLVRSIRRSAFIRIGNVMVQSGVKNFPSVASGRAGTEFIELQKGTPEEVCKGASDTLRGKDYEIWRGSLSVKLKEILNKYKPGEKINGSDLKFFFWDQELEIKDSSQEEFCELLSQRSKLHPNLTKGVYPESNRDVVHEIDTTKWESLIVEKACIISLPIEREISNARILESQRAN